MLTVKSPSLLKRLEDVIESLRAFRYEGVYILLELF